MTQEPAVLDPPLSSEQENTQQGKYLSFHLAGEEYGIEIRYVTEIVNLQKITKVMDMPDFIRGVINLRGKLVQVMDVRMRFLMSPREFDDRTCIIVVHVSEAAMGLLVDEVSEVADIAEDQIEPPPRTSAKACSRYIQGMAKIGQEVKILLDVPHLLYDEPVEPCSQEEEIVMP